MALGSCDDELSTRRCDILVLSRKLGEKIYIGDNVCITVVDIDRGKIRLGIEAPKDVPIYRQELLPLNQLKAREPHHELGGEG
jgi:carbon storage regulator